jgi:hypothetical protein
VRRGASGRGKGPANTVVDGNLIATQRTARAPAGTAEYEIDPDFHRTAAIHRRHLSAGKNKEAL